MHVHAKMKDSSRERSSSPISNRYPNRLWQDIKTTELRRRPHDIVARIFETCQESLQCLVQKLDSSLVSKRDRNILRRCHSVLVLWGEGHGVSTGALDLILYRSKDIRQMTLSTLNSLSKAVSRGP
jgi:hypothetical protein